MQFEFCPLDIPDVVLVKHGHFRDHRGSFSELYKEDVFLEKGIGPFVQENYSLSVRNVLRGLHFQAEPRRAGKLISCPFGTIYDVAVDLRKNSSTFGKWTGVILGDGNAMIWIPAGFAHGFCVLSDLAAVVYRQTQYYSKSHDRTLLWNDADVNVRWPVSHPVLSEKDKNGIVFKELFE
jgi:dTDP-4-dehydrorhamnose 3,5-epimerase